MSRQWTLPLEISEFKTDEYGKLAHVFGSIFPDYDRTPEEWRFEDESLDKSKFHFKRYSCINKETEEPVGFGQCQHVPGCIIRRNSGSTYGSIHNIRERA